MKSLSKLQGGMMLIEALVGILIFSIGILALVGMQATAVRNTTDARYRSEASFLATQIIGQMWVDITNLAKYDKAAFGAAYAPRDNWMTTVATNLPGIDLTASTLAPTITFNSVNREVTVVIQWQQPGEVSPRRLQMVNRVSAAAAP